VPSISGNNHWGGRNDRRTAIGEGANAGQTFVPGTSQRGTNHHKGEGEDEAYGPHAFDYLRASGFGRCPPFCWSFDNHHLFPEFCAKSGKWFLCTLNCFVTPGADDIIFRKQKLFQLVKSTRKPVGQWPGPLGSLAWSESRDRRQAIF
jgi:hypothetical protein